MFLLCLKVALHISATYLHQRSGTPPNPPPDEAERAKFSSEERFGIVATRWVPLSHKAIGCSTAICESAILLSRAFPNHSLSIHTLSLFAFITGRTVSCTSRIDITPTFLIGWLLTTAGGLLRIMCYRHLGRFFTFHLALRKDHQLITTGPYAIVRHPSYAAVLLIAIGSILIEMGPGSLLSECLDVWRCPLGWLFVSSILLMWLSLGYVVALRMEREDTVLSKEFGKEWDAWAERTPYRIIPSVY